MTTMSDALQDLKRLRAGYVIVLGLTLLFSAVVVSNRKSPRSTPARPPLAQLPRADHYEKGQAYIPISVAELQKEGMPLQAGLVDKDAIDGATGRSIIRTASIDMVVQHPAQVAQDITELAEKLGGYLVSADGGGQNATSGTLTVRVPVPEFEEARAEIRKMGLRVESEKFEARDVTQEHVTQEARIRNLRAEEQQYLAILQQAHSVNDMIFVSQKLSEVRGMIEKEEAEFNALSHQAETVAIAISLRTEAAEQVFGLNWHPLYELKQAAADGLKEVLNYGVVLATILFYLPAVLLWSSTILLALIFGWRTVQWIRRRWSHWTAVPGAVQG